MHVLLASAVTVMGACNVVVSQRRGIENDLQEAGLQAADVSLDGAQVRYWDSGQRDRQTVLLIHGFGASAIWQWHHQATALAKNYRVVVPDLLWFGGSTSPDRFAIDDQVAMLAALLDHLKIERAHVVGISYGGLVALELAGQQPQRVTHVVIADSPGHVYTWTDYRVLCTRFGVMDFGEVLVPEDEVGVERLLDLAYHDAPWVPGWAARQILEQLYGTHREEKKKLLQAALSEIDKPRVWTTISSPGLLVWGRDDPVFPLAIGERLQGALGDRTDIVVIDDARHAPNVEYPERFNQILTTFFQRH